jgi:hypothetical protein
VPTDTGGALLVPSADSPLRFLPFKDRWHLVEVIGFDGLEFLWAVLRSLRARAPTPGEIEPQVLVTVTRNMSMTATIVGEGGQGAVVPLSVRGTRLLEGLALAGGVRAQVHETFVNLSRDGRAVRVPLQSVMRRPQENI